MKTKVLFIAVTALLMSNCSPQNFYQLYQTESLNTETQEQGMLFENDEIRVIYNFWGNQGSSTFVLYNKTDTNLYVDLGNSHLIINDIATTYYQNRVFSESESRTTSLHSSFWYDFFNTYSYYTSSAKSETASKNIAVSHAEDRIINIPAKSAKVIDGFSLRSNLYRDCDLLRFFSRGDSSTKQFEQEFSPLLIRNLISYGFSTNEINNYRTVENYFWVSQITNYPSTLFIERRKPEFCGEVAMYLRKYHRYSKPDRFYIKYPEDAYDDFKH